jgi:hypothetical protein
MLKREELERLDRNMLAMYCLRVSESIGASYLQVEQARQLKTEWALFIGHTHTRLPGMGSQEDIEVYGKELKQRMVSFLARCSVSLSIAKEPAADSGSKTNHAIAGSGK